MLILRHTVFVAGWFAAALLPIWWIVQPGAFSPGWIGLIMVMLISPVLMALLLGASLVALLARADKQIAAVSGGFAVAAPISWLIAFLVPLSLDGVGDSGSFPSSLELAGVPAEVTSVLEPTLMVLFLVSWAASLALSPFPRPSRIPHQPPSPV